MASQSIFEQIKSTMNVAPLRSKFVKQWGVTIYFKTTSVSEAEYANNLVGKGASLAQYHAALVCTKALSKDKERIFSNEQVAEMLDWPVGDLYIELSNEMSKGISPEEAGNSLKPIQS